MLIPIGHDNMSARRWPVITVGLLAVNVVVFLFTHFSMDDQVRSLALVRAHILLLAAMHPELTVRPEDQAWISAFQKSNPRLWDSLKDQNRSIMDSWDANMRLQQSPAVLQEEMDSLENTYAELSAHSIIDRYAFVPANPRPVTYVT